MLMLKNDDQVNQVIGKLQRYQIVPESLEIRFNHHKKSLVYTNTGTGELLLENEYYENLEENLFYIQSFVLDRLINLIKCDFTLRIHVENDGSIDFSRIELDANIFITNTQAEKAGYIYNRFKDMLPLYSFIETVNFKRCQFRVSNIVMRMVLDTKKLTDCLKAPINNSILAQWMATYNQVTDHFTKDEFSYFYDLDVTHGRMHFASRKDTLVMKFT